MKEERTPRPRASWGSPHASDKRQPDNSTHGNYWAALEKIVRARRGLGIYPTCSRTTPSDTAPHTLPHPLGSPIASLRAFHPADGLSSIRELHLARLLRSAETSQTDWHTRERTCELPPSYASGRNLPCSFARRFQNQIRQRAHLANNRHRYYRVCASRPVSREEGREVVARQL